jgi:tetratricopeptide (TPR) repeat protein
MLFVVGSSDTGSRTYVAQWATIFGDKVQSWFAPVGDRDPEDQAEFWLATFGENPEIADDATLALGAAWILDTPQTGFMRRHTRIGYSGGIAIPNSDQGAVDWHVSRFSALCDTKCLEFIEQAVKSNPDDVELWRNKALLLCNDSVLSSSDWFPRKINWLEELDECAKHDPENALYDYAAAIRLWEDAVDVEYDKATREMILTITDQERFNEGNARFERAQSLPLISATEVGLEAVLRVMQHADVPAAEHISVIQSRHVRVKFTMLLSRLSRFKSRLASWHERAGDLEEAMRAFEFAPIVTNQLVAGDNHADCESMQFRLHRLMVAGQRYLVMSHPEQFDEAHKDRLRREYEELGMQAKVFDEIAARMNPELDANDARLPLGTTGPFAFAVSAPPLAVVTSLVIAALAWLCGYRLQEPSLTGKHRFSFVRNALVWILCLAVSIVVLGLIPAGIFFDEPPFGPADISSVGISIPGELIAPQMENHKLLFAAMQWNEYFGPLIWVIASSLLSLTWLVLRQPTADGFAVAIQSVKQSCLVVALLMVTLYSVSVAAVTPSADKKHHDDIRSLTDAEWVRRSFNRHSIEVRNEPQTMKEIMERCASDEQAFLADHAMRTEEMESADTDADHD